jgi:hypothetical protein
MIVMGFIIEKNYFGEKSGLWVLDDLPVINLRKSYSWVNILVSRDETETL